MENNIDFMLERINSRNPSHPFNYEPRQQLPFFKDPKVKISIWTVLKDSIGKDLSKITMPVYFN